MVGVIVGFDDRLPVGLGVGLALGLRVGPGVFVGLFVGFGDGLPVGLRVGLVLGLPVGPDVYGTHGMLGSRGIVPVSGRFLSNINCASPANRRYQSEGKLMPSASKPNHPPSGKGRSVVLAVTLKIAVPSSTSSN